MNGKRLTLDFYRRDTIDVARELLGCVLVHRVSSKLVLSGVIVETEAYLGVEDPAAHSFGGRQTPRTSVMFGRGGTSYIYFIYGMYFCFNVVTMDEGVPEAVLVRAVSPLLGVEEMHASRPGLKDFELANGPGKLCRALRLGREQNARNLCNDPALWIEEGAEIAREFSIVEGPRIGVDYAGDATEWPLRFGISGHPALSKPKFLLPLKDETRP
jgi:DNA-3-methyladenine glycosylase